MRISIKPSAASCVSRTWLVPGSPPWAVNPAGRFEMANGDVESRPERPTHLGFRISFGPQHSGQEIRQSAQAKAEWIVRGDAAYNTANSPPVGRVPSHGDRFAESLQKPSVVLLAGLFYARA